MISYNTDSRTLDGASVCREAENSSWRRFTRRCNAKAVNLTGGELRCGEIGAVIVSAEISAAVKCGAPNTQEIMCNNSLFSVRTNRWRHIVAQSSSTNQIN